MAGKHTVIRLILLFTPIILAIESKAGSEPGTEVPPNQSIRNHQALLELLSAPTPNHLLPLQSDDPYSYHRATAMSLVGRQRALLWMIAYPSFSPEYAVVIRQIEAATNNVGSAEDKLLEQGQWIVEYVEVKNKIWGNSGQILSDAEVSENVKRWQVPVTEDFAMNIREAWVRVLKLTRPPTRRGLSGKDGTTFEFYAYPNLSGQTWSPTTVLPKNFVKLGHRLRDLAWSLPEDREALQVLCVHRASVLAQRVRDAANGVQARVIDDFEIYDDKTNRLCDIWIDRNSLSSVVDHLGPRLVERTIVRHGEQSMPLAYSNNSSPFYSETSRIWDHAQDWTKNDTNTLTLWIRGQASNDCCPVYIGIEDGMQHVATVAHPDPNVATTTYWTEWTIPLSGFSGINMAKVTALHIGVGDRNRPTRQGTGLIYIDDIQLTAKVM